MQILIQGLHLVFSFISTFHQQQEEHLRSLLLDSISLQGWIK